ncbi:MAG: ComF family protein [Actinobacteria bacterium]|nr:ComF family protein [Actinomycetota bacterium]
MGAFLDAWGDLVLGACCPGCGHPALGMCRECAAGLRALQPGAVTRTLAGFPPTVAAGEYAGALRRVLLAAKERQALSQLPLLGRLLTRAVAGLLLGERPVGPVCLVPVPSVRARVIERGIDLTGTLAAGTARRLRRCGVEVSVRFAVRLERTPADQAGLGRTARIVNSSGAYRCVQPPPGSVVIVDDVVTTGATLAAMATALRTAGCLPVGAATVAHTARRGSR